MLVNYWAIRKIIGLSIENITQALEANQLPINYIGLSPVFTTSTKSDTAPPLYVEGVRHITSICQHPAIGIGGINLSNAHQVVQAGAQGIAVVSYLMKAINVEAAARSIRTSMNGM